MQVGVIAPIKYLRRYCVTNLQLCYASIMPTNEDYYTFYKEQGKLKKIVILDHYPKLPRKPYSYSAFCSWAVSLMPQLIVLPNYDFDVKKTVGASQGFVSQFYGNSIPVDIKRIGVLQGTTYRELRTCMKGLKDICEVWGLPCSLEGLDFRDEIVDRLELDKPTIYLEVNKDPVLEKPAEPEIKETCLGIVTSFPLRLAYEGRGLGECNSRPKPLDFNMQEEQDPGLVKKNVVEYIKMVR